MVRKLAARGFDVVLIGNSADKLQKVAALAVDRKTRVIEFDFGKNSSLDDCRELYEKFKELDVSILVNNVQHADFGTMQGIGTESIETMITVNCYSLALLTKLVLETFKRRWTVNAKRSLLINHCAAASIAPMPYLQTYVATKAFAGHFSYGLADELKAYVDVVAVRPFGLTESN